MYQYIKKRTSDHLPQKAEVNPSYSLEPYKLAEKEI